jgi:hypothetical protein
MVISPLNVPRALRDLRKRAARIAQSDCAMIESVAKNALAMHWGLGRAPTSGHCQRGATVVTLLTS